VFCDIIFFMIENKIIIFTDGASKGNPGPGGYGAVIVYPEVLSKGDGEKILELGGSEKHTTNNRMELMGAIKALEKIKKEKGDILIYTDSSYLINGITKWVYGWQKNNWKKASNDPHKKPEEVLNQDLWKKLADLAGLNHKNDRSRKINWEYVGGHIGIVGNERCDEIASDLATGEKVKLFKGNIESYKLDILNLGQEDKKKVKKTSSKAKAYCYLSLINNIIYRDATWPECEQRVKGVKNVKYKKAISPEDEQEIIRNWGEYDQQ